MRTEDADKIRRRAEPARPAHLGHVIARVRQQLLRQRHPLLRDPCRQRHSALAVELPRQRVRCAPDRCRQSFQRQLRIGQHRPCQFFRLSHLRRTRIALHRGPVQFAEQRHQERIHQPRHKTRPMGRRHFVRLRHIVEITKRIPPAHARQPLRAPPLDCSLCRGPPPVQRIALPRMHADQHPIRCPSVDRSFRMRNPAWNHRQITRAQSKPAARTLELRRPSRLHKQLRRRMKMRPRFFPMQLHRPRHAHLGPSIPQPRQRRLQVALICRHLSRDFRHDRIFAINRGEIRSRIIARIHTTAFDQRVLLRSSPLPTPVSPSS